MSEFRGRSVRGIKGFGIERLGGMPVRVRTLGGLGVQVIKTVEFVRQTPKDTGWGLSLDSPKGPRTQIIGF